MSHVEGLAQRCQLLCPLVFTAAAGQPALAVVRCARVDDVVQNEDVQPAELRLGLRIIVSGDISGPLSSCPSPQAALKFSYRGDRVTRH